MSKAVQAKPKRDAEQAAFDAAVREGIVEADAGNTISYEKIRRWLLSWGSVSGTREPSGPM